MIIENTELSRSVPQTETVVNNTKPVHQRTRISYSPTQRLLRVLGVGVIALAGLGLISCSPDSDVISYQSKASAEYDQHPERRVDGLIVGPDGANARLTPYSNPENPLTRRPFYTYRAGTRLSTCDYPSISGENPETEWFDKNIPQLKHARWFFCPSDFDKEGHATAGAFVYPATLVNGKYIAAMQTLASR